MKTDDKKKKIYHKDFAADDPKNKNSLKEILRTREVFCDYYLGENIYHSTGESWNKYFYYFNKVARNL